MCKECHVAKQCKGCDKWGLGEVVKGEEGKNLKGNIKLVRVRFSRGGKFFSGKNLIH